MESRSRTATVDLLLTLTVDQHLTHIVDQQVTVTVVLFQIAMAILSQTYFQCMEISLVTMEGNFLIIRVVTR